MISAWNNTTMDIINIVVNSLSIICNLLEFKVINVR